MPTFKHCPSCGAESSASATFCRPCRAELAEAATQSESTQLSARCPSCSTESRPGAKFCRSCGASLTETPERQAYGAALAVIERVAAGLTDEALRETFVGSEHVHKIQAEAK